MLLLHFNSQSFSPRYTFSFRLEILNNDTIVSHLTVFTVRFDRFLLAFSSGVPGDHSQFGLNHRVISMGGFNINKYETAASQRNA